MPHGNEDIPLRLLKRPDGSLCIRNHQNLIDPTIAEIPWPTKHEFSLEWLLSQTRSGVVSMDEDNIYLTLANGTATYAIDKEATETSTGYWGILTESTVTTPEPVKKAADNG
jgi:hypothetical protein